MLIESYKIRLQELAGIVISEAVDRDPSHTYSGSETRTRFSKDMMTQAIKEGREVGLSFQTNNEKHHMPIPKWRVIYPVAMGLSKKGNLVIRAFHKYGQSESEADATGDRSAQVQNEWRLFKAENIKFMWFTGNLFRVPPPMYNPGGDDSIPSMEVQANFSEIVAFQDGLNKKIAQDKNKLQKQKNIVHLFKNTGERPLEQPYQNPPTNTSGTKQAIPQQVPQTQSSQTPSEPISNQTSLPISQSTENPEKNSLKNKKSLNEIKFRELINNNIKQRILKEDEDIDWDLYDILIDAKHNVMSEFINALKKEKPKKGEFIKSRQSWEVIPFSTLQRQWEEYIKFGYVKPNYVTTIEKIEKIITWNILKINVNTELAGHTSNNPDYEWMDFLGDNIPDNKKKKYIEYINEHFGEFISDNQHGQMRISDYAMDKLNIALNELRKEVTPEKKLAKIDHILNIIHMRSDIASWFVEGGTKALAALSGNDREN